MTVHYNGIVISIISIDGGGLWQNSRCSNTAKNIQCHVKCYVVVNVVAEMLNLEIFRPLPLCIS